MLSDVIFIVVAKTGSCGWTATRLQKGGWGMRSQPGGVAKRVFRRTRALFLIWGLVRVMLERDFFWLLQEDEETEDRQTETVPKERERAREGRKEGPLRKDSVKAGRAKVKKKEKEEWVGKH